MDSQMDSMLEQMKYMMSGQPKKSMFPLEFYYNKMFVLSMHEKALEHHEQQMKTSKDQNVFLLRNTTNTALPSTTDVELISTNQVTIAALVKSIDKFLHGKFLLCRTLAPPFKITALATVIDDPDGILAIRASFYNYMCDIGSISTFKGNDILPVGTIFAIKNPWFKTMMDGGLSLRCDNPGDIVVMNAEMLQKLNPNLKWKGEIPFNYKKFMRKSTSGPNVDWKRLGNHHFVNKLYLESIQAYTNGLKSDPINVDLLANRAAAYLNIGNFQFALADTECVLKTQPKHMKAIFRKTRALWGHRKYDVAKQFLDSQVIPILPEEKIVKDLLVKAKMFILQSKFGQYPLKEIYSQRSDVSNLDWADFEGCITVRDTSDGRGRGMFATNNIYAGQLILANKAFGYVLKEQGHDIFMSSNLETKLINDESQAQLVSNLAHLLRNNPDKGKQLYNLYAGPKLGYLDAENSDECSLVDMKRIDAICCYNSFGHGSPFIQNSKISGLWITPSLINHSCIDCNCCWNMYGDFLFVRAFKDIPAGEEITISYIHPAESYAEREKVYQKFGFVCNCSLCEYDRNEPEAVSKEIAELLEKIKELAGEGIKEQKTFSATYIKFALPMIERLLKIRPKHRLSVIPILDQLSEWYYQVGEVNKAADILEMACQFQSDSPIQSLVRGLNFMDVLFESDQKQKAKAWATNLKNLALVVAGSLEVLDLHPQIMNKLKSIGIHI